MLASGRQSFKYGCYAYYVREDGLPMCSLIHPGDRIQACIDYDDFRKDDVYLLTYPKAGKKHKNTIEENFIQLAH